VPEKVKKEGEAQLVKMEEVKKQQPKIN